MPNPQHIELRGGTLDGQGVKHQSGALEDGATMTFQAVVQRDDYGETYLQAITKGFGCAKRKYRYMKRGSIFVFEKRI